MKKRTISKFIIPFLAISSLLFSAPMRAQDAKRGTMSLNEEKVPFYQGMNIGVDLLGLGSKLIGGDIFSAEVALEANLLNRYIPVIEVGYAQTETTNDDTNIYYKTAAPYFRVGANYNILFKKPYLPGYLFIGGRVGHTSFSYDVASPDLNDPVWGGVTTPISYSDVKSSATWGEIVFGIKTEVFKNVCMGLSARWKFMFDLGTTPNSEPWYIPGFGKNDSSAIGVTYSISYNLPF
ncbi:MAG: DUF6048 family protein [Phocaeicola sp.]